MTTVILIRKYWIQPTFKNDYNTQASLGADQPMIQLDLVENLQLYKTIQVRKISTYIISRTAFKKSRLK